MMASWKEKRGEGALQPMNRKSHELPPGSERCSLLGGVLRLQCHQNHPEDLLPVTLVTGQATPRVLIGSNGVGPKN